MMMTLGVDADSSAAGGREGTAAGGREGTTAVRYRVLAAMATLLSAVGEERAPPGVVDGALEAPTRILSDPTAGAVARECALRCFGRMAKVLECRDAPWLWGAIAAAAAASRGHERVHHLIALVHSCGSAASSHLGIALAAPGHAASLGVALCRTGPRGEVVVVHRGASSGGEARNVVFVKATRADDSCRRRRELRRARRDRGCRRARRRRGCSRGY